VTAEGNVVLDRDLTEDTIKVGNRQLSARRAVVREDMVSQIEKCEVESNHADAHMHAKAARQGPREMLRDVSSEFVLPLKFKLCGQQLKQISFFQGCLIVVICAVIVYQTDPDLAKFIDPVLSIVSALLLLALSFPYSEFHQLQFNTSLKLSFFVK